MSQVSTHKNTGDLRDDVVMWPEEVLSQPCIPVDEITDEIVDLAQYMLDTMYASDGCGLAAPQIGEHIQMIVIDVDYAGKGTKKNPFVLINPEIIVADGEPREFNEGCLSFPGISVEITRPSHVVVQAANLDGDIMEYEARNNLLAVCLQHEIDHIHGITMLDHLSPLKRAEAVQQYKEALERGAKPGNTC